ncbi:MAG: murein DD-endopeptidase MepM/ murein hydrolase activator NlpD [Candidatus Deianiraeaceae bacterium]|jgi:murein DD-endopeptidase MepM/ murein hydrolase activator NlpD
MKSRRYLTIFISFACLIIYTSIQVKEKHFQNEKAISKYFLDVTPDILDSSTIKYKDDYEENTDVHQLDRTQNLRAILIDLDVSTDDITKIHNIINIDKVIIKKGKYLKMLYQDDVDQETSTTILPPFVHSRDFVRNIQYLSFPHNGMRHILVKRNNVFKLKKQKIKHTRQATYSSGIINGSLYDAFITHDIPHEAFQTFVNIYSFDVDFQRDIRSGDKFTIVYDKIINDEGIEEGLGRVLYAKLNLRIKKNAFEYFILRRLSNKKEYYDRLGNAVFKTFMKTPINGARISSRFGYRKHPILGYSKLHTGMDFAAPAGTAIYAAADGVITFMGWNGGRHKGYGRYTVVKHNKVYSTAYAHQSRFNRHLRKGSKVRQGQVIGYVGSTGYSTGAHLHYEVMKYGRHINPSKITSISRKKVTKSDKISLMANIKMIDKIIRDYTAKI